MDTDCNPRKSGPAWAKCCAFAAIAALLAVLAVFSRAPIETAIGIRTDETPQDRKALTPVPVKDTESLVRLLDGAWKKNPTPDGVPNMAPEKLPAGLDRMEIWEKKLTFVRSVLPHVLHVNRRISAEREALQHIDARLARGLPLRRGEKAFLGETAERYRLGEDVRAQLPSRPAAVVGELLLRVDVIPPSLVLAQAALESAWGASRYVLEGNNLFGQLIYTVEKGMIPAGMGADAPYAVARFGTLTEAVEAYARNLNSLGAYKEFRKLRAKMRTQEGGVDSDRLAEGLGRYSERGSGYVEDIKHMIRLNRLKRFDTVRLIDIEPDRPAKPEEKKEADAGGTDIQPT